MPDGGLFDLIGMVLAATLTVMILSYVIRDNPLFRLAAHAFIGVSAGYAGAVAWHSVLKPNLVEPFLNGSFSAMDNSEFLLALVIPWILIVLLLLKAFSSTARLGALPVAMIVGVGAAVIVGGAVGGTLLPQVQAAAQSLTSGGVSPQTGETPFERLIAVTVMLLGTVSTLLYFHFSSRERPVGEVERPLLILGGLSIPAPMALMRFIGQAFIAVTFGVMYAGALGTALVAMSERITFLRDAFRSLLGV